MEVYYIHADHLGTPRKITRPSDNKALWVWESEAFGDSLPNQNPSDLGEFNFNLRFPGQYYDQETGLFYNYFRDYDPGKGGYIESDPIGLAGGINTYSYVNGNPVNDTDSQGLFLDETGQYLRQAAHVGVGVGTSIVSGVGLFLTPSAIGEELPIPPIPDPTAQPESKSPADGSKDCPPGNDDDCNKIIAEIEDLMKELTKRYMHQCRNRKNQWETHKEQFDNKKRQLAKLVAKVKPPCIVPPKAYEWLQTQCPVPGTIRNTSPGY